MAGTLGGARDEVMRDVSRTFELFEQFPDVVLAVDRTGVLVYASPAARGVVGASSSEALVGRPVASLVHPDDAPALLRLLGRLTENPTPVRTELRLMDPDGVPRWWEIAGAPSTIEGRALVLLSARDRTEDRAVRERLQRGEEMWRSIAENPFDFVMTVSRDGTIQFLNHAAHGWDVANIVGERTIYDFIPPETEDVVRGALRHVFETGERAHYEMFAPVTGRWYSTFVGAVKRGGTVVAASMLCRDITVQRRAEESQRRTEERYRHIVESTRDGIWLLDDRFCTTFVNQQLARMLGYSADEMLGRSVLAFVEPAGHAQAERMFERRRQGISEVHDFQFRHKNGSAVYATVSANPLPDEQGAFAGALAVLTDVTERRRWQDDLQRAQRMEAVGRLAGGIAHEFNNLLTSIVGAAELLGYRLAGSPDLMTELDGIRMASDRAAALVRRLLTFARKQTANPRVVDLRTVVEGASRVLASVIGEDIELELTCPDVPCTARVDPAQIEQVLLNLVVNGRDAMPSGGDIQVTLERARLVEGVADLPPGEYVILRVRDTGFGIARDMLDRVFEPFFTTKGHQPGAGLGLSIVYGVVKQSGGHVTVDSTLGGGTTFTIHLPFSAADPDAETVADEPTVPRGTETILVVEDDELLRGVTVRALRALGYRILLAEDGADALAVVERHQGAIDLVVTDVIMPRMGGQALVDELTARNPRLRVLFVSGHTEATLADRGGFDERHALLVKPFSSSTLARKVRELLDEGRTPGKAG